MFPTYFRDHFILPTQTMHYHKRKSLKITIDLQSLEKLPWILNCLYKSPQMSNIQLPPYFSLSSRFCCNFLIISLPKSPKARRRAPKTSKWFPFITRRPTKNTSKHTKSNKIKRSNQQIPPKKKYISTPPNLPRNDGLWNHPPGPAMSQFSKL